MLVKEDVDGFRNIDNINYDDLIESLNVDTIPPHVHEAHTTLLLNMLAYYDEIKHEKTLFACLWLSNYLWNHDGQEIDFINLCQVKVRDETLTDSDKLELIKIKNGTDDNIIKLACSILLWSFDECTIYYQQLSWAQKAVFKDYPIINLCDNLNKQ